MDTFDKYPFPKEGKYHHLYFEFAGDILGGDVVYRKAFTSLESYFPLHRRVNFHPKIAVGVSDGTVPLSERFTLGGPDEIFGLFAEELRGDKMFLGNLGLRFRFFHTLYWTLRYDMGNVWSKVESIKLKNLKHAQMNGIDSTSDLAMIFKSTWLTASRFLDRTGFNPIFVHKKKEKN